MSEEIHKIPDTGYVNGVTGATEEMTPELEKKMDSMLDDFLGGLDEPNKI